MWDKYCISYIAKLRRLLRNLRSDLESLAAELRARTPDDPIPSRFRACEQVALVGCFGELRECFTGLRHKVQVTNAATTSAKAKGRVVSTDLDVVLLVFSS